MKLRECKSPFHEGERDCSIDEFPIKDKSGQRRSWCRDCHNAWRVVKDARKKGHLVAPGTQSVDKARERREREAQEILTGAIDRQRRLSSDFESLKNDDFLSDEDFDTSVANRADMTSKERSQAAKEKRQEYSRAMGDFTNSLHETVLDDDVKLSAASGNYIGALAEQERRFGNRRLARSVSLYAAGEELSRRLWSMAARQYLTGRVVPKGFAERPQTNRIKRSVCLLLSDLHIGADLTAVENPLPYRAIHEARRLEYILRQVIDYKPQYRADSELVLLFNGDNIEGLLLHDLRDGSPLTEQKIIFQRYFEAFVAECASAFPSVRVYCQPGNHGRDKLRHPGRATSSKWDSHETGLYYALSRSCSELKNVSWSIPFRAISSVDLHGQNLLLTHGDTEVKIADPDAKAKDNRAAIDKINATRIYGHEFSAAAFGHFHKPRFLPGKPPMIFNGALVPPNGHARSNGWIGESCGQFLWEAVPGHPVGDVRFIEVGTGQDNDEALGTVIEPFRFDMDTDEFIVSR